MPLKLKRTTEGVIRSVDDHPGVICVSPSDDGLAWVAQNRVDPIPIRDAARARGERSIITTSVERDVDAEHELTIEEFVGAIGDPITLMTAVRMLPVVAGTFTRRAVELAKFDTAHAVVDFVTETERQLGDRAVRLALEGLGQ